MRKIELSEHFTPGKLLRYSLPSIGTMLAVTSFGMIDGWFVSTLLGIDAFAAVNLIFPPIMVLQSMGLMIGTGTSAVVSKLMGAGNPRQGREVFTMSVAAMLLMGAALGLLVTALMPPLGRLLGATEKILPDCVVYGRILAAFLPAFLVNMAFESLWVTAEKTWMGFALSIVNGAANAALDWLLMGVMRMGIRGAALGTSLAAVLSAAFTLFYFCRANSSSLRFCRFDWQAVRELGGICLNGASEMVDSVANSVTEALLNARLMRLVGTLGIVAMGVFGYVMSAFMSIFVGISTTAVTVVGYKFGEGNRRELDSLVKTGSLLTVAIGAVLFALCEVFAAYLAKVYVGYDAKALAMTVRVLKIGGTACLFYGFDIYISGFFTGLNDGLASAVIAGVLSLGAPVMLMFLLPALFGPNAIWYSVPMAPACTSILCAILIRVRYPKSVRNSDNALS